MWSAECGAWSVECGVWCVVCGVWFERQIHGICTARMISAATVTHNFNFLNFGCWSLDCNGSRWMLFLSLLHSCHVSCFEWHSLWILCVVNRLHASCSLPKNSFKTQTMFNILVSSKVLEKFPNTKAIWCVVACSRHLECRNSGILAVVRCPRTDDYFF